MGRARGEKKSREEVDTVDGDAGKGHTHRPLAKQPLLQLGLVQC
jgi:hypothetical protein